VRHLDLFSGYLGFSEAAKRVWGNAYEFVSACEIERNCQHVIRRHRPGAVIVPDIGDLDGTACRDTVDLITFGSPCQDLSVAGKRKGLDGERSGLFFSALRIVKEVRPRFFIFENVPGLLSSNKGRDMGTAVGEFQKLGDYTVCWRSLDLQYFGCPQRRERIFAVGSLGDASCVQILFEPESLCWDFEKGGEAGEEVAGSLGGGAQKRGWCNDLDRSGAFVPEIAGTLAGGAHPGSYNGRDSERDMLIAHTLKSRGFDGSEDGTGRGTPIVPVAFQSKASCTQSMNPSGICPTMDRCKGEGLAIAFTLHGADKTISTATETEVVGSIRTRAPGSIENSSTTVALQGMQVRRLTPRECERLQGLDDDWTAWGVDEHGKREDISDSARYRMIGNGVGLPVVEWIMRRIEEVIR
jgi:DNA (cytosine-5)-methyltransferase 1